MNLPKILMVEDDEQLGEAYVTRLQAENMNVLWVKNGEEALAETVGFGPDIMLLDIMMPRISGFDVLDILKNTPETRDTKIIVLSALSSPDDIEKARLLGASDYLVKAQITMADVVATIHRHLGDVVPPASSQTQPATEPSNQAGKLVQPTTSVTSTPPITTQAPPTSISNPIDITTNMTPGTMVQPSEQA